jgi:hypothetical protein
MRQIRWSPRAGTAFDRVVIALLLLDSGCGSGCDTLDSDPPEFSTLLEDEHGHDRTLVCWCDGADAASCVVAPVRAPCRTTDVVLDLSGDEPVRIGIGEAFIGELMSGEAAELRATCRGPGDTDP